jgi:hypothetical protein
LKLSPTWGPRDLSRARPIPHAASVGASAAAPHKSFCEAQSPESLGTSRTFEAPLAAASGCGRERGGCRRSYTGREIAKALVISEKTVEPHRANILLKLGLRDRVALTRYAIRRGLVEA